MKLLFVTDTHITRTPPKFRTSDFYFQIMGKWHEVFKVAYEKKVDLVVHGGDLFHTDNPDVQVIMDTMRLIDRDVYLCVGNHDFHSDSWQTLLDTTALGLMEHTKHIKIPKEDMVLDVGGKKMLIRFSHYFEKDDPNRFVVKDFDKYALVIMVVHDALVNEDMPFKHLLVSKLKVDADLVLCGHYHIPFKYSNNRTLFINPGSMTRLTRLEADMKRVPNMVYVEFDGINFKYQLVPFKSAQPWDIVFKTEQIEQAVKDERDLAEEFTNAIQASIGATNIEEMLVEVAKNENIDEGVVELCRKYLRKVAS